jgi:hypothetical protein
LDDERKISVALIEYIVAGGYIKSAYILLAGKRIPECTKPGYPGRRIDVQFQIALQDAHPTLSPHIVL